MNPQGQKYQFNELLRRYRKYLRKEERLKGIEGPSSRIIRKLNIISRKISSLFDRLIRLQTAIKLGAMAVSFAAFTLDMEVEAQNFAPYQKDPFGLTFTFSSYVAPADLDDDGDIDILHAHNWYIGGIWYYENVGTPTAPAFSLRANPYNLTNLGYWAHPTFGDLDGDGDFDLIYGIYGSLFYRENTGTPTSPFFGSVQQNPFGLISFGGFGTFSAPTFGDLDGDGDLDILTGGVTFKYFENTGTPTSPAFAAVQTNPFGLTNLAGGYYWGSTRSLGDLDQDGDLDLIGGAYMADFYYFENIGTATSPSFGPKQLDPFNLVINGSLNNPAPAFLDLDADGDLDVLAHEGADFYYFENISCNFDITKTDASCLGGDGTIDLIMSGPDSLYTYLWSTGDTTQDLSGLTAGTYVVEIADSDSVSCNRIDSVTIIDLVPTFNFLVDNVSCTGDTDGSIDLTYSGGIPPFSYNWTTGDTTNVAAGLAPGTYGVTVTDSKGCSGLDSATVMEPSLLQITAITSTVACYAVADGSIDLVVAGGTPPYFYLWSNSQTTQDIDTLTAGTYTALVTDSKGCTTTDSTIVNQTVGHNFNIAYNDISCNGNVDGSIDLTVPGQTSFFSYLWSTGDTTEDLSGLTQGTYVVTITDSIGCPSTFSIEIIEPALLSAGITGIDATCHGASDGQADLSVNGGTPPYSFLWSNGTTSEDASGLTAGAYTVTITDSPGCWVNALTTISEPAGFTVSHTATDATCYGGNDGTAEVMVNGGAIGYTYLWSNGDTTQQTSGLTGGLHTVIVTDITGCDVTDTVVVEQPDPIISSIVATNTSSVFASDGGADLSVSGGTPPYAFFWSNQATTEDLTGLQAGIYRVTIIDSNFCSALDTVIISAPIPTGVSADKAGIKIYPNPTSGYFTVEIENGRSSVKIKIYNLQGQLVLYEELANHVNTIINLSEQSSGLYFIQITTNEISVTKKILLE